MVKAQKNQKDAYKSDLQRLGFAKYMQRFILNNWQIYLLLLLPFTYIIVFKYIPMAGAAIAFQDYSIRDGIMGSEWVGFKYFARFINSPNFWLLIKNTVGISLYTLIAGFPIPIMLAPALNEVGNGKIKKIIQTVTYAPHFISTVVMVSIITQVLDPHNGIVNQLLGMFGVEPTNFMGEASMFKSIYVWSGVWQSMGYSAIIYIAALSGISPELYEAAQIDGASRLKKIIHIDLPGIAPTIIILLIMQCGQIMSVGYEKVYLMQNDLNRSASEIISTFVYRVGLVDGQFSFSTAVGLFNSAINFILLLTVNKISSKVSETSLW